MHLQSTFGAFLVAFTMVNGTPVVLQNDPNSRGITTPINIDNLPHKPPVGAIDHVSNNRVSEVPEHLQNPGLELKQQPKDKAGPNDNTRSRRPWGYHPNMTPEEKERSRTVWQEAKAGGPRGDGRPDGGRAGAAPPVKRSPARGGGGKPVGWKGKLPDPHAKSSGPGSDRKGPPSSDRKHRGPVWKGPDSERKGGDPDRQGEDDSNGIRDGITDGIHDGFTTGFELAADEFANQAAANNEKRKVPVPDKENKVKDSDKKTHRKKPWEGTNLPDLSAPRRKPWEVSDLPDRASPDHPDYMQWTGQFAEQPPKNEKRKVPDADMKKKKFDDLKEKLDRMGDKDYKPSWRVKNPCGGPACIQDPLDNPIMSLQNTDVYAGVPQ